MRLQGLAGQPRRLARVADDDPVAPVRAAPGERHEHVDVEDRLARARLVAGVELLDPGRAAELELAPGRGGDRERRSDRDERARRVEVLAVHVAQHARPAPPASALRGCPPRTSAAGSRSPRRRSRRRRGRCRPAGTAAPGTAAGPLPRRPDRRRARRRSAGTPPARRTRRRPPRGRRHRDPPPTPRSRGSRRSRRPPYAPCRRAALSQRRTSPATASWVRTTSSVAGGQLRPAGRDRRRHTVPLARRSSGSSAGSRAIDPAAVATSDGASGRWPASSSAKVAVRMRRRRASSGTFGVGALDLARDGRVVAGPQRRDVHRTRSYVGAAPATAGGELGARRRRRSEIVLPSSPPSTSTASMSSRMSGRPRPRSGDVVVFQPPWSRTVIATSPSDALEHDVEEVGAELVGVLDRVLARLVAGHRDVVRSRSASAPASASQRRSVCARSTASAPGSPATSSATRSPSVGERVHDEQRDVVVLRRVGSPSAPSDALAQRLDVVAPVAAPRAAGARARVEHLGRAARRGRRCRARASSRARAPSCARS